MENETIGALRRNWPAAVGWTIFIVLLIALLAGHYVFIPFIFGFTYYVGYVISQTVKTERGKADLTSRRLFGVCLIGLLYLGIAFMNEYHRYQFIHDFERTCYRSRYTDFEIAKQLCDEIHTQIDNYLTPTLDDDNE